MKEYTYIWTYIPTESSGEETCEWESHDAFLADLDKWNRSNPDTWKYEEKKVKKLHKVRMIRTQTVEIDIIVFSDAENKAELSALTSAAFYNYNNGKIIETFYKAKATG